MNSMFTFLLTMQICYKISGLLSTKGIAVAIVPICIVIALGSGACIKPYGPETLMGYYIEEKGTSLCVDDHGFVYVGGLYSGTADFGPGTGINSFTAAPGKRSNFLSRFDSSGSCIWVRTWDDLHIVSYPRNFVESNDIYFTGSYSGMIDLNPGPEIDERDGAGDYLIKIDFEGNFQWVRDWHVYEINSVSFDGDGYIYVTGSFANRDNIIGYSSDPVDLDPGPGEDMYSGTAVFLSKFNPDGEYLWAEVWDWAEDTQVIVDGNGGIFLTGIFIGPNVSEAGQIILNSSGLNQVFLSKVDADGNIVWAHILEGTIDASEPVIATDLNSNLIIGGTLNFRPDLGEKTNIFLNKCNSDGNIIWGHTWGGSDYDFLHDLTVDANGNIYATGYFVGNVDLDPGSTSDNHRSRGPGVYLSKFDSAGNYLWSRSWGGPGWDTGNGIAIDANGFIYVTGEFCGRVDFDPGPGRDWHSSTGYNDIFLSKFDLDGNFIWAYTWGGENPFEEF